MENESELLANPVGNLRCDSRSTVNYCRNQIYTVCIDCLLISAKEPII